MQKSLRLLVNPSQVLSPEPQTSWSQHARPPRKGSPLKRGFERCFNSSLWRHQDPLPKPEIAEEANLHRWKVWVFTTHLPARVTSVYIHIAQGLHTGLSEDLSSCPVTWKMWAFWWPDLKKKKSTSQRNLKTQPKVDYVIDSLFFCCCCSKMALNFYHRPLAHLEVSLRPKSRLTLIFSVSSDPQLQGVPFTYSAMAGPASEPKDPTPLWTTKTCPLLQSQLSPAVMHLSP